MQPSFATPPDAIFGVRGQFSILSKKCYFKPLAINYLKSKFKFLGSEVNFQCQQLDTNAPVHQYRFMRLSFTLEPELYRILKSLARERDSTLNAALHELLRRALRPSPPSEKSNHPTALPKVTGRRPFTSDDVYSIEKENG